MPAEIAHWFKVVYEPVSADSRQELLPKGPSERWLARHAEACELSINGMKELVEQSGGLKARESTAMIYERCNFQRLGWLSKSEAVATGTWSGLFVFLKWLLDGGIEPGLAKETATVLLHSEGFQFRRQIPMVRARTLEKRQEYRTEITVSISAMGKPQITLDGHRSINDSRPGESGPYILPLLEPLKTSQAKRAEIARLTGKVPGRGYTLTVSPAVPMSRVTKVVHTAARAGLDEVHLLVRNRQFQSWSKDPGVNVQGTLHALAAPQEDPTRSFGLHLTPQGSILRVGGKNQSLQGLALVPLVLALQEARSSFPKVRDLQITADGLVSYARFVGVIEALSWKVDKLESEDSLRQQLGLKVPLKREFQIGLGGLENAKKGESD